MICGVTLSIVSLSVNSYAETNVPEGRAIIGEDTRVRVMDTTKAPYSSIIYLLKADGGFGSGTVIGKNKVLTAAHVVTSLKTSADISKARVSPARNDYYYPFGSFSIESIDMHTGWTVENNRDYDIAVVTLKPNSSGKNIGDVVPIIPVKNVPNIPTGTKGLLPGYSQDKHGQLWEAKGSVISQTTLRVYYDMDSIGGTSGAPVYNENNQLMAVHTSEYRINGVAYKNAGSKITGSNYEFIAKHLGQNEIDTQAPSQVTGVRAANITTNSTQLFWNPATDNVGVEKYEVYRNGSKIGESKTTAFAATGLIADSSYTFSIIAVDQAGNRSKMSTGVTVRTEKEIVADTQAPSQVTGVKASDITSTSAQLNWNASTDNIGVEKYEVYRNGSRIGESRTTKFELSGLTANTTYTISIAALDKAGNRSDLSTALIFNTEKEVEKPSENQTTWVQSKTYVAGDKVFYDGIEYRAKWWTQGNKPGMSDAWEKLSTSTIEEWKSQLAYSGGNVITFKGVQYKAKWWNRGEEPGKSTVWEKI
nr:carbohydrate-binding protein [Enterococcus sp. DIV0212c]